MHKGRACIAALAVSAALICGCRTATDTPREVAASNPKPGAPIRLASASIQQEQEKPEKNDSPKSKEKIDLPTAIQLCTLQNFRLQASATKIAQAEADLLTASLVPNPSWFNDLQLLPLQRANPQNQLGPPQQDSILTIPIDWLVFGKRAAAMQAQQLGVAVARAGQEDAIRKAVSDTVDAFYAILQAEELLKLAKEEHNDAKRLQEAIDKLGEAGKIGELERGRVRLMVLDVSLALGSRESELKKAKAKLRPLIGRTATDADFEVVGSLAVEDTVPPPELSDAITLAEARRPDMMSDRHAIAQASANVHSEQRKAKPQVSLTPGWSYQYQRAIAGFRNGSMLDVGFLMTLPITDRNQGNIRKAEWQLTEAQLTHQANVADLRAEVESVLNDYIDAVEDVRKTDDPVTRKDALELKKKAETEFVAGQQRLVAVLDARKIHQEWQKRHVEIQATYWRSLNKLNTVVGLTH